MSGKSIDYWSNINLFGQVLIVFSGLIATIMMALQDDNNKHWTKPIGLIATALITTLTSALVSFHVPDNVDKLIDTAGKMTNTANKLSYDSNILGRGMNDEEIKKAYISEPGFRKSAIDITNDFVSKFSELRLEVLKLSGTAAKLNQPTSFGQPPNQTSNPDTSPTRDPAKEDGKQAPKGD